MKTKLLTVLMVLTLVGAVGCTSTVSSSSQTEKIETTSEEVASTSPETTVTLTPAENWEQGNHIHGLAIHPNNPDIVYVATHQGLVQNSPNSDEWFWVGKERADYMGFTADPTNSKRFYSSGHPHTGGNLGFRVSNDGGETWEEISMEGVDFHALAIAPSNPNIFYGWATSGKQGFFTSNDGGKTWNQLAMKGLEAAPFSLAVTPNDPQHVYATTGAGLFESSNGGESWDSVVTNPNALVTSLAFVETEGKTWMYGYRMLPREEGLYRSADGGKTWELVSTDTQSPVYYLASAPSSPNVLYATNENNTVLRSEDGGESWTGLN